MKKIMILLIIFLIIFSFNVFAEYYIYGNAEIYFGYLFRNTDNFLSPSEISNNNMFGIYSSNLYFSFFDQDNYKFFIDLCIEGNFTNTLDDTSNITYISNAILSVNQLYLSFNISNYLYFNVGKKPMEFGTAKFFNVSNRISPSFYSDGDFDRSSPGVFQILGNISSILTTELILYFDEINKFENIDIAGIININHNLGNIQIINYIEDFDDISIGWNSNIIFYLMDMSLQFYTEGIAKWSIEQKSLVNNPTGIFEDDFIAEDKFNITGILGVTLVFSNSLNFSIEYCYRQEGADSSEFDDVLNSFNTYGDIYKKLFYQSIYNSYAYSKHYVGVSFSKSSLFIDDFNFSSYFIFSIYPKQFMDKLSCIANFVISYNISTNLYISIYYNQYFGKEETEMIIYNSTNRLGMNINYNF